MWLLCFSLNFYWNFLWRLLQFPFGSSKCSICMQMLNVFHSQLLSQSFLKGQWNQWERKHTNSVSQKYLSFIKDSQFSWRSLILAHQYHFGHFKCSWLLVFWHQKSLTLSNSLTCCAVLCVLIFFNFFELVCFRSMT